MLASGHYGSLKTSSQFSGDVKAKQSLPDKDSQADLPPEYKEILDSTGSHGEITIDGKRGRWERGDKDAVKITMEDGTIQYVRRTEGGVNIREDKKGKDDAETDIERQYDKDGHLKWRNTVEKDKNGSSTTYETFDRNGRPAEKHVKYQSDKNGVRVDGYNDTVYDQNGLREEHSVRNEDHGTYSTRTETHKIRNRDGGYSDVTTSDRREDGKLVESEEIRTTKNANGDIQEGRWEHRGPDGKVDRVKVWDKEKGDWGDWQNADGNNDNNGEKKMRITITEGKKLSVKTAPAKGRPEAFNTDLTA